MSIAIFFFFNDTATTEIYTLSLHDALPISLFELLAENPDQRALLQADPSLIPAAVEEALRLITPLQLTARTTSREVTLQDRKSTRLNSSHANISYAVFCLKKKKKLSRHTST